MKTFSILGIAFLLVAAAFAGIPPNSISITNHTGSTVSQPYIISRFFAKGEIPHYAQPEGIPQWQDDVKTRWPDGSVQHVLISFWKSTADAATDTIQFVDAGGPCYLGNQSACNAAALDSVGMLSFNSSNWGAAIEATQSSTTYATDARTLIAGGHFTYWVRGPVATVAVVEDRTPARSKDFGWTCASTFRVAANPSTDTFSVFDLATGLTPVNPGWADGKRVYLGTAATPGPQGVFTSSSQKLTTAKYLKNSTAQTFKLAATLGGAAIDVTTSEAGATYVTGCGADDYSANTWNNDAIYKSLHPQFILTFFPGWSGVYIEYVMQNGWTTAFQDQRYQIALLKDAGNATTVRTATIPHWARSEWVYRAWSGTGTTLEFPTTAQIFTTSLSPPMFAIDFNKQYMIYSKMVPQNDPRLTVDPATAPDNDIDLFQASVSGTEPFWCDGGRPSGGVPHCADYFTQLSSTGARGDLGLNPRWHYRWIYASGNAKQAWLTVANGDVSGLIPYHMWEGAVGKWYDTAHTIDAFGLPLSINARPTVREYQTSANTFDTATAAGDHFTFVDPIPVNVGVTGYGTTKQPDLIWDLEYSQSDPQHNPAWHYIPYLATGDYFYLEDMLAYVSQYPARSDQQSRHQDWGMGTSGATRGLAWSLRGMITASLVAPDGTPEKAYFLEKANNNIADLEAMFEITDGHYAQTCNPQTFNQNTETNKYCWALFSKEGYSPRYNFWNLPMFRGDGAAQIDFVDGSRVASTETWFGSAFLQVVLGFGAEVGFNTDRLSRRAGQYLTRVALTGNTSDLAQYFVPVSPIIPSCTLAASMTASSLTVTCASAPTWRVTPPYPVRFRAAASSTEGEAAYICSASGATLTVCPNGRGAMKGSTKVGSSAGSHAIGDFVELGSFGPVYANLTDWHNGFLPANQSCSTFLCVSNSVLTAETGYVVVNLAAISFSDRSVYSGGLSQLAAWKLVKEKAIGEGMNYATTYNPKFYLLPRREPVQNARAEPADTSVAISYHAPTSGGFDAGCTVDGVSDGQSTSQYRTVVKTGLTAGSGYTSTIHCDADYYDSGAGVGNTKVTYSTAPSLSGNGTFSVALGPGGATAYLDFGTTPSMGSTVSGPCGSGCTLSATVPRGLIHYRIRRDAGTGQVSVSLVQ